MKSKTRNILIGEGIFIVGVLVYLFFATAPSQIYPLSGMTISDPDFTFEIENSAEVVLSVDINFTNPIVLFEASKIVLPPGLYYWKVRGENRESEIKNFTVQSRVGLDIKELGENYELRNSGNVDLDVSKTGGFLTGDIVIEVGEFTEVEKNNLTYTGVQK